MINGATYGANIGYGNSINTYAGTGIFNARRRIPDELSKRMRLLGERAAIQFLITATAGYWLKGAVLHSGAAYKFSDMPAEQYPIPVQGVYMNGGETSLDEATSIANCVSTVGSFYFDSGNRVLYVNPPTGRNIYTDTFQAKLAFYFSRKTKHLRGIPWVGRLMNAPSLSLRIDARFTGVGQVGSGSISLANRDGFFDELDEAVQWDAGTVTMEIGVDYPDGSSDMDEADYQTIGTWRIEKASRSGGNFNLSLREPKTTLENKIPRNTFTRVAYPNIADDTIGKPIPLAYGRLFGVKPVAIDKSARKFKLADHAIKSIEAVRVRNADGAGGWRTVSTQTQNLNRAEFTLSTADWSDNEDVSVDLLGRMNLDGTLMENPADVMQDLLDYCGEKRLDSESFNASRSWYRVGTNRFGEEVTSLAPCIYLEGQRTGLDVASEINSIAGSFLFVGHDGFWRYGAFRPVRAVDLDPMAGTVIQQFSERDIIRDSLSKDVDGTKVVSKLVVEYAERKAEDWAPRTELENPDTGFLHNLPPKFTETKKVGLGNKNDADYWGQRYLNTEAQPMIKMTFAVPWLGFFLLPGNHVHIEHERQGVNEVREILEAHYNFNSPPTVRLVTGNNRGRGHRPGHWIPEIEEGVSPTQLDMILWLRPENHIYSTDGDFIQTWRDASGLNNHGRGDNAYGTPLVPTYQHTSISANGLPVVKFEDINPSPEIGHWIEFDSISTILQTPPQANRQGEIFAVLKPATIAPSTTSNGIWAFGDNSYLPHTAGDIREGFGVAAAITGISAANLVSGWNLYNVSRLAGNMTVRVNTTSVYNANPLQAINFTPCILGVAGGSNHFDGAFAEVIVYKRVLSASERADVVQYLSDKYALGLVTAGAADDWNPAWTDTEVATAVQNNGYWTEAVGGVETGMADATDQRSHGASEWW